MHVLVIGRVNGDISGKSNKGLLILVPGVIMVPLYDGTDDCGGQLVAFVPGAVIGVGGLGNRKW